MTSSTSYEPTVVAFGAFGGRSRIKIPALNRWAEKQYSNPKINLWSQSSDDPQESIYMPRRVRQYRQFAPLWYSLVIGVFLLLVDGTYRCLFKYEYALSESRSIGSQVRACLGIMLGIGGLHWRFTHEWTDQHEALVHWGVPVGVGAVFIELVKRSGNQVYYAEFGEVPGTIFVDSEGLYHTSSVRRTEASFLRLPISQLDRLNASEVISKINSDNVTQKQFDSETLDLPWDNNKQLVYVNGVVPVGSGLFPRFTAWSRNYSPKYSTNADLLREVLKIADDLDFYVLYKDHPNVHIYEPTHSISGFSHPRLHIAGNVNTHVILNKCNAMVTIGSKTVLLAVLRRLPVCLVGPFTFGSSSCPSLIFETGNLMADIRDALSADNDMHSNAAEYEDIVARLLRYHLHSLEPLNND